MRNPSCAQMSKAELITLVFCPAARVLGLQMPVTTCVKEFARQRQFLYAILKCSLLSLGKGCSWALKRLKLLRFAVKSRLIESGTRDAMNLAVAPSST